jgi:transposase
MKRGNWVGEGTGRGMGIFRTRCEEGQERWPDAHENEWESTGERAREVGGHL